MAATPITLRALEAQRNAKDYALDEHYKLAAPWRNIPEDALPFSKRATVDMSAAVVGTAVLVVTYKVPRGFRAVLSKILNLWSPASDLALGAADVTWTIDINTPIGAVSTPSGRFLTDYGQITTQLGSFENGPWPLDFGERFNDGDEVRYKCTVNDAALVQPGRATHCMLIGWNWPGERLGRDA